MLHCSRCSVPCVASLRFLRLPCCALLCVLQGPTTDTRGADCDPRTPPYAVLCCHMFLAKAPKSLPLFEFLAKAFSETCVFSRDWGLWLGMCDADLYASKAKDSSYASRAFTLIHTCTCTYTHTHTHTHTHVGTLTHTFTLTH